MDLTNPADANWLGEGRDDQEVEEEADSDGDAAEQADDQADE